MNATAKCWLAAVAGIPVALLLTVLPGSAAPRPAAVEMVKLSDREFDSALFNFLCAIKPETGPEILPDLWLLIDRLAKPPQDPAFEIPHSLKCGYIAQVISRVGDRADFGKLLRLSDELAADSPHRRYLICALLDRAVQAHVAGLVQSKTPVNVVLPEYTGAVPPALNGATPELLSAWRTYQASAARATLLEGRRTNAWISAQENWAVFFNTLSDLLHGRLANASERLAQFQWGGWCGTGRDMLDGPRNHALFLALLTEHRYDQALGVLLRLSDYPGATLPTLESSGQWRRDFITLCGLDWETVYAGATLANGPHDVQPTLRMLARFGTEKGARLVTRMASLPALSDQTAYLRAVGTFVGASQPLMQTNANGSITVSGLWWNGEYRREVAVPIPVALQAEGLNVLANKLQTGVSTEDEAGEPAMVRGHHAPTE